MHKDRSHHSIKRSCFLSTKATEVISKLYAAHQAGEKTAGFDIEGEGAAVKDVVAAGILDLYLAKYWGLKLATDAATTVLRVDQVNTRVTYSTHATECGG